MGWGGGGGVHIEFGECKEITDFIIKPNGWTVGGSDRYHRITQERTTAEGVDIVGVLTTYQYHIGTHCCKLVCRNVDFDTQVVQSALIRANTNVADVETCCTTTEGIIVIYYRMQEDNIHDHR